jgi:hypothetical protein
MICSQLGQRVRGAEGRRRRLVALVAGVSAGTVGGLLKRVNGEHAEANRKRVAHGHLIEAASGFARDIVEVGRLSPDDSSQGNKARVSPGFRRRRGRRGELESTWKPDHVHFLARKPGFLTAGECPIEQLGGDQLVVAAYQDRHSPGGAQAAGEVGHDQWVKRWPSLSRFTCR